MTDLKVEWSYRPDALVVTVTGEIDAGTVVHLRDSIVAARAGAPATPAAVILDLSRVGFLDSGGLGLLVEVSQECEAAGQQLTLVCTNRPVLRPLELTGLDQIFTIADSVPPSP